MSGARDKVQKLIFPGTVFVKFKTVAASDPRVKIKGTAFSEWHEAHTTPRSVNSNKVQKFVASGKKIDIKAGQYVCFMAHHTSTLLAGLYIHYWDYKFNWAKGNGGIFYDYWEEKNSLKVKSTMQRHLVSGSGLAQTIEKKTRHQHHYYLCDEDMQSAYGFERMRQVVPIAANTTLLGIRVRDIIKTDVAENVSTSYGGELTWEAVQEFGGAALQITHDVLTAVV
jgi:hypothetical protein